MNKKNWIVTTVAAATAVSLLVGAGAYAKGQGHGGGMEQMRPDFSELDVDGDGKLTVAEIKAQATTRFDAMDTNGDGVISAEENAAAATERAGERAGKMFARLLEWRDADGDGGLSQAEMGDMRAQKMFNRADADGDGIVTAEEYEQLSSRGPRGERGGHGNGHGKKGNHGDRQGG